MISALRCSFGKEVALCCQEPMMTQVQNSIITHHPSTFIFTVLKMENTGKHNLFPSPDYLALDTTGKTDYTFLKSKSNLSKSNTSYRTETAFVTVFTWKWKDSSSFRWKHLKLLTFHLITTLLWSFLPPYQMGSWNKLRLHTSIKTTVQIE